MLHLVATSLIGGVHVSMLHHRGQPAAGQRSTIVQ